MKTAIKIVSLLLALGILFAFPASVLAQTPPPENQTFSGDQLVLGNNYTLKSGQTLNGALVVLGGNADIQKGAIINGDVAIAGGNLNLSGTVEGTISILGGNVSLTSDALVSGDIVTFGGNVSGQNEATIQGSIRSLSRSAFLFNLDKFTNVGTAGSSILHSFGSVVANGLLNVLKVLGMALLALVVALIMPKPLNNVAETITSQPLISGGVGLLTLIIFPIILVILTVTIILIPATLLGAVIFAVAALLGWIAAGTYIGQRMEVLLKTKWADAVRTGLGTLVIGAAVWLLGYIFCLGGLLSIIVASIGLGGVVLSRFGTQIYNPNGPSGKHPPYTEAITPRQPIVPGSVPPDLTLPRENPAEGAAGEASHD